MKNYRYPPKKSENSERSGSIKKYIINALILIPSLTIIIFFYYRRKFRKLAEFINLLAEPDTDRAGMLIMALLWLGVCGIIYFLFRRQKTVKGFDWKLFQSAMVASSGIVMIGFLIVMGIKSVL